MSDNNTKPSKAPAFFSLAIVAGLMMLPMLFLMDHLNGGSSGGDGLQGFWTAIFIIVGCLFTSIVCMVIGFVRGERRRWLVLLAIASWVVPLPYLGF
jgi:heme/copper-type cytochrome/quinol oxidase subunit 4